MRKRTVLAIAAFLAADAALVAWWLCRSEATVSEMPRNVATETPPARPPTSRVKSQQAPADEAEHASTLSVRVFDESDKPLAGASVELRREDQVVATLTTDADGAGSFGVAPPRPYEVEARIAGRGGEIKEVNDDNYGRSKRDLELRLHLLPGVPSHGRVVDDTTGRPVAGARVRVTQYEPSYGMVTWIDPDSYHVWAIVTTDAVGAFRVPAIPSGPDPQREWKRLSFVVAAPGYQTAYPSFVIDEMRPGEAIGVELTPTRTVHGIVFLPDGSPASGAVVRAESDGQVAEGNRDPATTDSSGRFSFDGVPVGAHWQLEVTSADGVASGEFHRVLAPASPAPDVELRLVAAASIVVHALGQSGRRLTLDEDFSAFVFIDGFQRDGTDGLKPGTTRLHVYFGQDREWCGDVDAHAGANEVTVDFGASADVCGTARDDAGAVIPSAVIEVRVPDRAEDSANRPRCVTADAEGRFRIPWLAKSIVRLRVRSAAHLPQDLEFVAPAQDVALTARRAGGVSVRLRLPPGGAWPERASAYDEDESDMPVRRGCRAALRDGVVEVSGIRPGHRRVCVYFEGYKSLSLDADVKAGATTELADVPLVTEVFDSIVELKLRAVDTAGAPVAGAVIAVGTAGFEEDYRVGADGVRPMELERGELVVRARAPGLASVTNCTVTDATREIVVTLRPARRVWIRVDDHSDEACRVARIEVRTHDGLLWDEPRLDSRLRAALDLTPGAWRLRAIDRDDKTLAETDFDVPASGDAPIDVALTVR